MATDLLHLDQGKSETQLFLDRQGDPYLHVFTRHHCMEMTLRTCQFRWLCVPPILLANISGLQMVTQH